MWFTWDINYLVHPSLARFPPLKISRDLQWLLGVTELANEKSLFMGLNQESCCKYEVEALYARKNS